MATGLQAYLDSVGIAFGALLGLVGDVLTFVLSQPVLAIPVATAILWTVINIVKSFIYGQN